MKAVVTVGLGFGDEGKGATIDYLARSLKADLVVRYCGGAQAGHNVWLPDGRRHTFAQFGAGTLAGVPTYLGPRMIISPSTLLPEAEHLRSLGIDRPLSMISFHPDCLVSTHYHVLMNRLREIARGAGRHGSCGLGIGEARSYWLQHGQDAIVAADLKDRRALVAKLSLLRDRLLLEMQELANIDESLADELHESLPAWEADQLLAAAADYMLADQLPAGEVILFEGAQGVLLDEWKGFHPHTTWSTVTPYHAWEMIHEAGIDDVTVLGVTRAYATRHGAGPFPTHCPRMSATIVDPGNPDNAWQGSIRKGPLDLPLLDYAARVCRVDGLVVNSLDQLPGRPAMCVSYKSVGRLEIPGSLREQSQLTEILSNVAPTIVETDAEGIIAALNEIAPVTIAGHGPTHLDRRSCVEAKALAPTTSGACPQLGG